MDIVALSAIDDGMIVWRAGRCSVERDCGGSAQRAFLGTSVVDGSAAADHYVISEGRPVTAGGCLSLEQLEELRRTGRRLERSLGGPQDLELAFDQQRMLWLLQARPITTIFPVPSGAREDDLRVYLEAGHMQGMRRPITPMGMSVLRRGTDDWL
jgi:pyruvate,water dikinase